MMTTLDTALLRSFIAIAETGTFSKAAYIVGRTQSALSLQIKRLEDTLGCEVLQRHSRSVTLTEKGEIFLNYAKQIIQLQAEAFSRIQEPDIEGEIHLGTPEDFATHYLPQVLANFRKHHPRVQLNVKCDLTLNLLQGFYQDAYDIVLVKRDPHQVKGGTKVWREPLIWVAAPQWHPEFPLPLVLSPQPCIYRSRALAALDKGKKSWRITYTSPSLAGTLAAVKAGLGITVLPSNMLPNGIVPLHEDIRLPRLNDAEIALLKRDSISRAGKVLADYIVSSLEQEH